MPDRIEPNESRGWQTESDGFLQGTAGDCLFETHNPSQRLRDQIYIWWKNPWVGVTNSAGVFRVDGGFFEDRVEAKSKLYSLKGGGRRPLGTFPGFINTQGWIEVIAGTYLTLPIPNPGVEDHAWIAFLLSELSNTEQGVFGTSNSHPDVRFIAVNDGPPEAWTKTWVFPSGSRQSAEVVIDVESATTQRGGLANQMEGFFYNISLEEKSATPGITVQGARYSEGAQRMINR
jgi:hypothetical protein